MKGSCRGLIWGTILAFIWRGWRNPRSTSVRIVGIPVHIEIGHFPNTSQNHYSMSQLLLSLGWHLNPEPPWYQSTILIATAVCKCQQTLKPHEILLVKVVGMDTTMYLNPILTLSNPLAHWVHHSYFCLFRSCGALSAPWFFQDYWNLVKFIIIVEVT
jgi:hypothetical protein